MRWIICSSKWWRYDGVIPWEFCPPQDSSAKNHKKTKAALEPTGCFPRVGSSWTGRFPYNSISSASWHCTQWLLQLTGLTNRRETTCFFLMTCSIMFLGYCSTIFTEYDLSIDLETWDWTKHKYPEMIDLYAGLYLCLWRKLNQTKTYLHEVQRTPCQFARDSHTQWKANWRCKEVPSQSCSNMVKQNRSPNPATGALSFGFTSQTPSKYLSRRESHDSVPVTPRCIP